MKRLKSIDPVLGGFAHPCLPCFVSNQEMNRRYAQANSKIETLFHQGKRRSWVTFLALMNLGSVGSFGLDCLSTEQEQASFPTPLPETWTCMIEPEIVRAGRYLCQSKRLGQSQTPSIVGSRIPCQPTFPPAVPKRRLIQVATFGVSECHLSSMFGYSRHRGR